jgi:trans-aconitate 2-methyltransferase
MGYHWDAEDYERHSSPQQQWAQDVIRTLKLKGDEKTLDIGCGDGKVTAELAALLLKGSVLGIDNSEAMIDFAHRRFPPAFFPNMQFRWGEATRLTYCHEFDLVTSFASLHWVHDHLAVLAGIKRALKPGGRVVLQFGGEGNAALISAAANHVSAEKHWKGYFVGFTYPWLFYGVEEYKELISRVGLSEQRIELIPKDMVHDGKEALQGWVHSVFLPYTARLPEALRDDFVEEVASAYVQQQPPDESGHIHVQMVRLEVEATL